MSMWDVKEPTHYSRIIIIITIIMIIMIMIIIIRRRRRRRRVGHEVLSIVAVLRKSRLVQGSDIPRMEHRIPFVYHLALLCKLN